MSLGDFLAQAQAEMLEDMKAGNKVWLTPVDFPNPSKEFSFYVGNGEGKIICLRAGRDSCTVEDLTSDLLAEIKAEGKSAGVKANSDVQALKDLQSGTARNLLHAALGIEDSGNDDASRELFNVAEKSISKFFGGFETMGALMDAVKPLIAAGADPNWHDEYDTTLCRAAMKSHAPLVEALIATGKCNVNLQVPYNQSTALHQACRTSEDASIDVVRMLIKAGADVTLTNSNKETPLHCLCDERTGSPSSPMKAYLLIEAGAPLDTKQCQGKTPLELAEQASTYDDKGEAAKKDLIEVLKDPTSFALKAKAAEEAAEKAAAAKAAAGAALKGERIQVKHMGYGLGAGTDAEFSFELATGGKLITEIKFDQEYLLPARFTSGDKDVPWDFMKATLSNFFDSDYNFFEGSMWSTDGDTISCLLLPNIKVKKDGSGSWSGTNEWENVVLTFPITKRED